jgi:cytochrome b561
MAALAERSLNSFLARAYSQERMLTALYGCTALLAVVIGVLGLAGVSWPRQMLESWINIHVLFGLLLCGLVYSRCHWRVMHSPHMLPPDIRQLSRHLSRIVYLLLYLVIGVRESISILGSLWHGGALDFNLFDARFRQRPDYARFNPKDDFQLFFASGLFALIFVRVLAFRLWLRFRTRAAAAPRSLAAIQREPADHHRGDQSHRPA